MHSTVGMNHALQARPPRGRPNLCKAGSGNTDPPASAKAAKFQAKASSLLDKFKSVTSPSKRAKKQPEPKPGLPDAVEAVKAAPATQAPGSGPGSRAATMASELAAALQAEAEERQVLLEERGELLDTTREAVTELEQVTAVLMMTESEKEQLADRVELLRANLAMLEVRNSQTAREVAAASAAKDNALRLRDVLLAQRDGLANQLLEAQDALQAARKDSSSAGQQLEALQQRTSALEGQLRDKAEKLVAADALSAELLVQLQSMEVERSQVVSERDELGRQLRDQKAALSKAKGRLQRAEEEQQALELRSQEVLQQVRALQGEVSSAEVRRQQALAQAQQVEARLQQMSDAAVAAAQEARSQSDGLRQANQQLQAQSEELQRGNEALAASAAARDRHVSELQGTVSQLRAAVSGHEAAVAALQGQLAAAGQAERGAAAALAASEAALAAAHAAAAAAAAGRGQAEAELAELRQRGASDLGLLKDEVSELRQQLKAARSGQVAAQDEATLAGAALRGVQRQAKEQEARLATQLQDSERRVASLQRSLHLRTLAANQLARTGSLPLAVASSSSSPGGAADAAAVAVGFTNANRFWVPDHLMFEFMKALALREAALVDAEGFLALQVASEGGQVYRVATHWESIPQWESWSTSRAARVHHLPHGIFQYVPRKGEGFPEDFIPLKDASEAINAKY